jgi:glutathione S-transferase
MLKIYGTSMSRAARPLWAAEELGLKFEHIPVAFADTRKPEYLKLNPNGHIPTVDDDGTIIWESMATTLYLAEKYGKAPFWPSRIEDRAHAYQWSFWGITETEAQMLTIARNRMLLPQDQRDEKAAAAAAQSLKAPLQVLDGHLKGREYLLGSDFTIADLNVASVLVLATFVQLDLSATPVAKAWLDRCLSRPSMQKTLGYK